VAQRAVGVRERHRHAAWRGGVEAQQACAGGALLCEWFCMKRCGMRGGGMVVVRLEVAVYSRVTQRQNSDGECEVRRGEKVML